MLNGVRHPYGRAKDECPTLRGKLFIPPHQMLWGVGGHECLSEVSLHVVPMADFDLIEIHIKENALGHDLAQVALGDETHEWQGIDHLIKAAKRVTSGDDRVIVWAKRRRRAAHGQRTIVLVRTNMREDTAIRGMGGRMVAPIDHDQIKSLGEALQARLPLKRLDAGHYDITGMFIPRRLDNTNIKGRALRDHCELVEGLVNQFVSVDKNQGSPRLPSNEMTKNDRLARAGGQAHHLA